MFEVYKLQPANTTRELFGSPRRRNCVAEPDLNELMGDPMTLALMAADRVDHKELNALFAQVRSHLR
jgi:hypothetical protein